MSTWGWVTFEAVWRMRVICSRWERGLVSCGVGSDWGCGEREAYWSFVADFVVGELAHTFADCAAHVSHLCFQAGVFLAFVGHEAAEFLELLVDFEVSLVFCLPIVVKTWLLSSCLR